MKTSSQHQAPIPVIPLAPSEVEGSGARDLLFRSDTLQPATLEGAWIEIFRAGDYGERGTWSPHDLDLLAASYNPRLQAAPVVLGHPAEDAPAYGWVRGLRRAGASLWAQLEKVDPAFEALLRAGRFRQRSVALYTHFPPTGGPYLRHLGFLGAAPPEVKGLAPLRFLEAPSVTLEFTSEPRPATCDSSEVLMSDPKSKLEALFDHLRAFFTPEPAAAHDPSLSPAACPERSRRAPAAGGRAPALANSVIPSEPTGRTCPEPSRRVEGSAFAERLAAFEQRLDALVADKLATEEKLSQAEQAQRQQQVAHFVESLRRAGRFPPAFDHWGVAEFMQRLALADVRPASPAGGADIPLCPTEKTENETAEPGGTSRRESEPSQPSLTAWFQEFLTRLPAVIEFRELGSVSPHGSRVADRGSRLIRFTEPQRGMSIDPASVELAERAEALAAELGISYAEALTKLREEARAATTA